MNNFSLDQVEDALFMIDLECPSESFPELYEFQCECDKFNNCFECWYRTVTTYQSEQFLKTMNDNESEDK